MRTADTTRRIRAVAAAIADSYGAEQHIRPSGLVVWWQRKWHRRAAMRERWGGE